MRTARSVRWVGVLAAVTVVLSGGTAVAANAAGPQSTQANVTFRSGTPLPSEGTRFDGAYVASTKRVYFLGWRLLDNTTTGEVWYYDVATKSYVDTGTAMPTAISNYTIAPLTDGTGDGLYVFGGRTDDNGGTIVDDVQVYYPATNTAVKLGSKDAFPGTTPSGCVSLPATGVAVVGDKAIVTGGSAFSANGCVADENSSQTWVFDPMAKVGSKWTQGPDLNLARGYITDAVLNGKVYAIGGDVNDAGTLIPQTIVESWKPFGGTWNDGAVADLPEACDESQAFAFKGGAHLANTITLAGCGQWPNALADVLQYDVAGDSWSTVGTLLEARRNQAGAVTIGANKRRQLFVVGGYSGDGSTTLATSEIGRAVKGAFAQPADRVSRGGSARASLL